ncbi:MAG: metallophosphoesterase family protein [Planctomycetes bacterium]|nr:metallophosphoesterase family protein [Planctomycetota bacterium]
MSRLPVACVVVGLLIFSTLTQAAELRRSPYLLEMKPDGVTIRWRTDRSSPPPALVRYGSDPNKLDQALMATELPAASNNAYDWTAKLTGLKPNTKYYYALDMAGVTLCGGDEDCSFITSPPVGEKAPLRFWCLGDSGSNRPRGPNTDAALKAPGPGNPFLVRNGFLKFNGDKPIRGGIILLGDNGNPQGTDVQYQTAFFQTYPKILSKTALWPCVGNHDMERNVYGRTFATAKDSATSESTNEGPHFPFYYSADIGNVHLVILDPWWTWWTRNTDLNHRPWRQQMEWLDKDLAATKQEWIILGDHFPCYADGNYNSDGEGGMLSMLRKELVPLCDKHGVDMFLAGHDHSYQRSFLISKHLGDGKTFDPKQHLKFAGDGRKEPIVKRFGPESGTIYVVHGAGGGGRPGGNYALPAMVPMPEKDGKVLRGIQGAGSFVIDVDGLTLTSYALDAAGNVLDQFSMQKQR